MFSFMSVAKKGIVNLFCFNFTFTLAPRAISNCHVTLYFLYINFFARLSRKYPKVSYADKTSVDEDSTSFISFSSCDVTWRLNFIPRVFPFISLKLREGEKRRASWLKSAAAVIEE